MFGVICGSHTYKLPPGPSEQEEGKNVQGVGRLPRLGGPCGRGDGRTASDASADDTGSFASRFLQREAACALSQVSPHEPVAAALVWLCGVHR